jgi:hypothetical protein
MIHVISSVPTKPFAFDAVTPLFALVAKPATSARQAELLTDDIEQSFAHTFNCCSPLNLSNRIRPSTWIFHCKWYETCQVS